MIHAKTQLTGKSAYRGQWQVWLEADYVERARRTIQELAVAFLPLADTENNPAKLAELALFYGYLAQSTEAKPETDQALACVNAAIQAAGRQPLLPHFIGGYPQVGWVLTQFAGKLFAQEEADNCQVIDEALVEHLQNLPSCADYDLISGLTGLGVYALARLPADSGLEVLQLVLQRLAELAERNSDGLTWFTAPALLPVWQRELCPRGYYNFGLAHGLPGVIALLARACEVEAVHAQAKHMLEEAVRWLRAHLLMVDDTPYFPAWLATETPPERTRLAWCYGDLGGAIALLFAARRVAQTDWEELALRILRRAAQCRGKAAGVKDAGLCHGAAGNAHLFNRLYQATSEACFQDAARDWYVRLFDYYRPELGLGGFPAFQQRADGTVGWMPSTGFLSGAAGVGLSLLAATSTVQPAWDECMLVSLSPR